MKINIMVTLKKSVLDPQGTVIQQALNEMGFNDVNEVRQGKFFEINIDEKDQNKAEEKADEMCKKLLANLVIEDYKIIGSQ
jgi:phosphoribosylformylglycinamidine synthase